FNSFRELCAVHKIGGAAVSQAAVLRCANVAAARAGELTTFLKEEEEKADKEAVQRRRALLRGRAFADVSSTVDEAVARSTTEKVDLGAMTDFATLHAPIALRDDPTQAETAQQVTSMAELLASLETSADLAETQPSPPVQAEAGLAMTEAARDEFRQLAGSSTLRALIHGAGQEQAKVERPTKAEKPKTVAADDSDSEEEGGVLQSEFDAAARAEAPKPAKTRTKTTTAKRSRKKKALSSSDEDEDEDMDLSAATISVVTDAASGDGTSFRFDQVLSPRVDQAGVFDAAASDVVDGALGGYNGCILAYGQTGAGKTFTMSGGGPQRRFQDRGLVARALARVFQRSQQDADHVYTLRVSYLEIYNDRLLDLLAVDAGHSETTAELAIQENARGQTVVRGLTRALVASEEQALDLLFQGDTSRAVAEHALNAASTRSHCIFTLYLERRRSVTAASAALEGPDAEPADEGDDVVFSKLHLVDLAGSERMKKTQTEAGSTRANEACHINRSLTFLEQVVLALGSKTRAHVPFRQTPLTNLLKDSLGGNCRTMLVACVWPAKAHADQSLATLRFAARMRRVKTQAVVNVAAAAGSRRGGAALGGEERAAYRDEIRRLREELALHDALAGRTRAQPADDGDRQALGGEEAARRQQVAAFLADSERVPPIQSLQQTQRLLQTFRCVCLERQPQSETRQSSSKLVTQLRALRGHTPPDSGPASAPSGGSRAEPPLLLPPIGRDARRPSTDGQPPQAAAEDDKQLFERFKALADAEPAAEAVRQLGQAKQNLREAKTQVAALALAVNGVKIEIDGYALQLQDQARGREAEEEEERQQQQSVPLVQLKDAKRRYRDAHEQLQEKKAEVRYLAKIKAQMLRQVAFQFQAWKDRREFQESQ
ncbi:hypothetical protein BBJ28_00017579, partial [Nothophytophthora sp. Chile5]